MTNKNNNLALDLEPLKNDNGLIATLCLNRPEVGNALNEPFMAELHRALDKLDQLPIRLLILKANGKHFCTGADLNWMRQAKELSKEDNQQDALSLALLIKRLDRFPAPTMTLIQGAALWRRVGFNHCLRHCYCRRFRPVLSQ